MERPVSHTTDALGEIRLREAFESVGWAVNRIEKDYGIDFDVQVFENCNPTGEWFKVQLKSSDSTQYSASADFISETLSKDHAAHYSSIICDPIFVIYADVRSRRLFWFAPQLEAPVAMDDPRSTVTVRIETANELPATLADLVASIRRIRLKLGARRVAESPISEFAKTVEGEDQTRLIKNFQNKTDAIRINHIYKLTDDKRFEDATADVEKIVDNSTSSIEIKFSALQAQERIEYLRSRSMDAPQSAIPALRLAIAKRLQTLTRKGPSAFKFAALIFRKAAELEVLTFRDLGLSMNVRGHVLSGDVRIALPLAIEQLQNSQRIMKKYSQCLRLARYASNSRYRAPIAWSLLRVVQAIGWFTIRLRMEGQADVARRYRFSALSVCKFAVSIAEQYRDDATLFYGVTAVMLLVGRDDDAKDRKEHETLARDIAAKINDPQQRKVAEEVLGNAVKRTQGEKVKGDPEYDVIRQIIENRAASLGIEITNPNDSRTKLVRLGIKDASTERAIRHCGHAFVSTSRNVPPSDKALADLLQLPSICGKVIHCDLHHYAIESRTLDAALEQFKAQHCDKCQDVELRPPDWKYSEDWQEQENIRHRAFMRDFNRRTSRS